MVDDKFAKLDTGAHGRPHRRGADHRGRGSSRGDGARRGQWPCRGGAEPRHGDRPKPPPVGPRPALRFPLDPTADPTAVDKPRGADDGPHRVRAACRWPEPKVAASGSTRSRAPTHCTSRRSPRRSEAEVVAEPAAAAEPAGDRRRAGVGVVDEDRRRGLLDLDDDRRRSARAGRACRTGVIPPTGEVPRGDRPANPRTATTSTPGRRSRPARRAGATVIATGSPREPCTRCSAPTRPAGGWAAMDESKPTDRRRDLLVRRPRPARARRPRRSRLRPHRVRPEPVRPRRLRLRCRSTTTSPMPSASRSPSVGRGARSGPSGARRSRQAATRWPTTPVVATSGYAPPDGLGGGRNMQAPPSGVGGHRARGARPWPCACSSRSAPGPKFDDRRWSWSSSQIWHLGRVLQRRPPGRLPAGGAVRHRGHRGVPAGRVLPAGRRRLSRSWACGSSSWPRCCGIWWGPTATPGSSRASASRCSGCSGSVAWGRSRRSCWPAPTAPGS